MVCIPAVRVQHDTGCEATDPDTVTESGFVSEKCLKKRKFNKIGDSLAIISLFTSHFHKLERF